MSDLTNLLMSMDDAPHKRGSGCISAPFGFPGGKTKSLVHILPELPYRRGYGEPCGGSGAVLLARNESKLEVFNDRYAGVVAFYRCLRDFDKCRQLIERLELCLHSREEWEHCNKTWKDVTDDIERAARWYYSLTLSFSQKGWSFGRATKGTGMLGKKFHNSLTKSFWPVHNRLKNCQIENLDWRLCLKDYDAEDFVWFIDPPYWGTIGVYDHEFTKNCHVELCERIMHLHGFVALSGFANPLYDHYKWDKVIEWELPIKMTALAFTDTNHLQEFEQFISRGYVTEKLWIKS